MSIVDKEGRIDFIQPTINYKDQTLSGAQPIFQKIYPQNGQSAFNLSLGATSQTTTFYSPSKPFVSSKSFGCLDLTVPAQAANTYTAVSAIIALMVNQLQVTAQRSQVQFNYTPNSGKVFAMLNPICESLDRLNAKPNQGGILFGGGGNLPAMNVSAALAAQTPISNLAKNLCWNNPDGLGQDVYAGFNSYRRIYLSSAVATANYLRIYFPLDMFDFTATDHEELIDWNDTLQFDWTLEKVSNFAWGTTSASNPSTGAIAASGVWAVNNFCMYFCLERNELANEMLRAKTLSSGIHLYVPWVNINKFTQTGLQASYSLNITPNNGSRLLFIATGIYNATESGNTNPQHDLTSILSGGTWTSATIQTTYGGTPLQPYPVDLFNGEQYANQKPNYEGSCIANMLDFNQSFVWSDNFSGATLSDRRIRNSRCGKDIGLADTYQFQLTAGGASLNTNVYVATVTQKEFLIDGSGVHVLNQS